MVLLVKIRKRDHFPRVCLMSLIPACVTTEGEYGWASFKETDVCESSLGICKSCVDLTEVVFHNYNNGVSVGIDSGL